MILIGARGSRPRTQPEPGGLSSGAGAAGAEAGRRWEGPREEAWEGQGSFPPGGGGGAGLRTELTHRTDTLSLGLGKETAKPAPRRALDWSGRRDGRILAQRLYQQLYFNS